MNVGGLHRHRGTSIVRAASEEETPEVSSEPLPDILPGDVPKPKISKVKSARKPRKTPVEGVERKPRVKKEIVRPTFDDMSMADFQELWIRLCENDVEYNEMKVRKFGKRIGIVTRSSKISKFRFSSND